MQYDPEWLCIVKRSMPFFPLLGMMHSGGGGGRRPNEFEPVSASEIEAVRKAGEREGLGRELRVPNVFGSSSDPRNQKVQFESLLERLFSSHLYPSTSTPTEPIVASSNPPLPPPPPATIPTNPEEIPLD